MQNSQNQSIAKITIRVMRLQNVDKSKPVCDL
jgi:hypothetical protein